MPRSARGLVGGGVYHVLNRGNGRQKVFHKDADYKAFLDLIVCMQERYEVELYAYCLMPNHYHLVVKAVLAEGLSDGMRWFSTTHVRRYHKHYKTSGHLWQGRYKSFVVEDDDHLLTLLRYVEGNPVRAGMVESAIDWDWSSHLSHSTGSVPLSSLPIELPNDWTAYVDTPLTEAELDKMK